VTKGRLAGQILAMKNIIITALCAGAVVVTCVGADKLAAAEKSTGAEKSENAKAAKSDAAAMQGTWKGKSVRDNPEHQVTFVVSGKTFDFHDETETNNWYKGTFTLKEDSSPRQFIAKITECPFPQYVGKTSKAIYKIEDGTLTITANEPGKEEMPADFDSAESACIEVKKK
jgi:uncharacterized protein (TIGR03067 family)